MLLALLRRQHAGQRRLDLVHRIVNDVVVADVDAARLGQLARRRIGAGVEADDDRLRGQRQVDVGFGDAADGGVHHLHLDFGGGQLLQGLHQRFLRTLHVGLDDQRQVLDFAFGHLLEHVFQLGRLLLGQLDVAELALAEQADFARLALVGHHHHFFAGDRHFGQALDLDRNRRAGFVDRLAVFVQHRPHAAKGPSRPARRRRASACRTAPEWSPPGRGPCPAALRSPGPWPAHRPAPSVPALRPAAAPAPATRRCPSPVLAETGTNGESPPYSSGTTPSATSSCLTRSGLASGLSILVIATTSGTPAALAWAIASLVCGITPSSAATTRITMSVALRAARTHRGKRFVARRIEEGDHAARRLDVIGADMLGNAAGFAGGNLGAADVVQQRGLAVVDVAHDGDHRCARQRFHIGVRLRLPRAWLPDRRAWRRARYGPFPRPGSSRFPGPAPG